MTAVAYNLIVHHGPFCEDLTLDWHKYRKIKIPPSAQLRHTDVSQNCWKDVSHELLDSLSDINMFSSSWEWTGGVSGENDWRWANCFCWRFWVVLCWPCWSRESQMICMALVWHKDGHSLSFVGYQRKSALQTAITKGYYKCVIASKNNIQSIELQVMIYK